jgi:hypothetical protein
VGRTEFESVTFPAVTPGRSEPSLTTFGFDQLKKNQPVMDAPSG